MTIHIGRTLPRRPIVLEEHAVVDLLCHGRAQVRASALRVGDVVWAMGVVTAVHPMGARE